MINQEIVSADFINAAGPVVGGEAVTKAGAEVAFVLSELTVARLQMGMTGSVATAGNAVGAPSLAWTRPSRRIRLSVRPQST